MEREGKRGQSFIVGDEQRRETESKNAKNDDPRAANS